MEKRSVEEVVNNLISSGENINAYVHNTSISIRRVKEKGLQLHTFYGGEEAKKDYELIDFYTKVLKKLTENSPTLRQLYNI